jgi:hypothetical protein
MPTLLEGITGRKLGALRTRFWQYVHEDGRDHNLPPSECWKWQGALTQGYPVSSINGGLKPARFIAYALEVEDFEEGCHVLAMCRNRLCVNPAHMKLAIRRPENEAELELKLAAQAAVNAAVWQYHSLPQISTQRCADCGAPATGYHHRLGYSPENWLEVEPLCTTCHRRAEWLVIRESRAVYTV